MTKEETQRAFVLDEFERKGYITRNECLRCYISRLSAIIFNLRAEGYVIEGQYYNTVRGRDYNYKLISTPQFISSIDSIISGRELSNAS